MLPIIPVTASKQAVSPARYFFLPEKPALLPSPCWKIPLEAEGGWEKLKKELKYESWQKLAEDIRRDKGQYTLKIPTQSKTFHILPGIFLLIEN